MDLDSWQNPGSLQRDLPLPVLAGALVLAMILARRWLAGFGSHYSGSDALLMVVACRGVSGIPCKAGIMGRKETQDAPTEGAGNPG